MPTEEQSYFIGQRVLLNNSEIGTISKPEHNNWDSRTSIWVFAPSKGYPSAYALRNVKPLPNGQL